MKKTASSKQDSKTTKMNSKSGSTSGRGTSQVDPSTRQASKKGSDRE